MLNIFSNVLIHEKFRDKIVVMNTFLFPQLSDPIQYSDEKVIRILKRKQINSDTQFLVIPINLTDRKHWSLAIICNLNLFMTEIEGALVPSDRVSILYLDSLMSLDSMTE